MIGADIIISRVDGVHKKEKRLTLPDKQGRLKKMLF